MEMPVIKKVNNLDDYFNLDTYIEENNTPKIKEQKTMRVDKLVNFKDHPFKLYEGQRLDDMVQSIKNIGMVTPVIVRPKGNETYEILSGHNRVNASKMAGLTEVPVIIKDNLTDEEIISLHAAYDLSFLSEECQEYVSKVASEYNLKINMKSAAQLRGFYEDRKLNETIVYRILTGELVKRICPKKPKPIMLSSKIYGKYLNPNEDTLVVERIIDKALAYYFKIHPELKNKI